MKIISLLLLPVLAQSAFGGTQWEYQEFVNNSFNFTLDSQGSSCAIPNFWTDYPNELGAITTTNQPDVIGDLHGKVLHISVSMVQSNSPAFGFPGAGDWNRGNQPANFRVFFCQQVTPYCTLLDEQTNYTLTCWWCSTGYSLVGLTQTNIGLDMESTSWSATLGQSRYAYSNEWNYALSHVGQIGVMFGGGSFYDVGVYITNNASAKFSIDSFYAQDKNIDPPIFTNGMWQLTWPQYGSLQTSTDLVHWADCNFFRFEQ
ncbi:MAG: hypothetical protein KGL39_52370 [Patescibacteria group bacterium]|nr:hypothetical protein [Patescibacteria group bacterium]